MAYVLQPECSVSGNVMNANSTAGDSAMNPATIAMYIVDSKQT